MQLPIDTVLPDLKRALHKGPHAVLQAPPGAGKTTGVPLALLNEEWLAGQRIIMLEPRRLAARRAAQRMADVLDEAVGQTVGYRIRFDSQVGSQTRIEVVTEGILTRRMQNDPALTGVGLVVFDEFHERSIHADLGLALCLDTQEVLRQDLRILVMSATLQSELVAALLNEAPIITGQGQTFPVETRYLPPPSSKPGNTFFSSIERNIVNAIRRALVEDQGSILVFLPGEREIRQVERLLNQGGLGRDVLVAPLYGRLSREAQDLAILPAPAGTRKVVLATSIAETSLTIEGVNVVIDCGFSRVARFDPKSGMTRLETVRVSRASADQRRGRAGRTAPGLCYRLWSTESETNLLPFNEPEIRNADLASLALELALWGVSDPMTLKWLDSPPRAAFAQARSLLTDLHALDTHHKITPEGRRMASFGLHPRLSHMLIRACAIGQGRLACRIAALLSERDIMRHPEGPTSADLRVRIEALQATGTKNRAFADSNVDRNAARRIIELAERFEKQLELYKPPSKSPAHDKTVRLTEKASDDYSNEPVGIVLAFAYPDRIAQRRPKEYDRYVLSGGRGAWLSAADPLTREEYLVVAELDGDPQEAQIFLAAPVDLEDLVTHCAEQISIEDFSGWDDEAQAVVSWSRHLLGRLIVRERQQTNPSNDIRLPALLEGIRKTGLGHLPWDKKSLALRSRIAFIGRVTPKPHSWPEVSDSALLGNLECWLAPFLGGITRLKELQKIDLVGALFSLLSPNQQRQLDRLAPTHLPVPSGSRVPLDYGSGDTPVLSVRLQEMFGCSTTPTIAGQTPVIVHLLSPAGRPIQVTSDLANFWATTYHEVKKELCGRYPKHFWPDNPLGATPTKRAKPRKK